MVAVRDAIVVLYVGQDRFRRIRGTRGRNRSFQPQSRHAAIGMHRNADMRQEPVVIVRSSSNGHDMMSGLFVPRRQRCRVQQWNRCSAAARFVQELCDVFCFRERRTRPLSTRPWLHETVHGVGNVLDQPGCLRTGQVVSDHGNSGSVIACKVGCINVDDCTTCITTRRRRLLLSCWNYPHPFRQLDETPIMAGLAAAPGFPSVHDLAVESKGVWVKDGCTSVLQQIARFGKPFVRGEQHAGARCERETISSSRCSSSDLLLLFFGRSDVVACLELSLIHI